ncbi:MAG TPA: N-acetylneuraminate synthase family protein [Fimbriimonas sp.]|nr:N-acetylneuraminate synthase family protein [Fimbriimonas sp.]
MAEIKIGDTYVGDGRPCFVIAEIGINHNGSVELAKRLIDMAASSGCDAVKFQKRTVDVVYTPEELAKPRKNPFGETNGALKRGLEFDLSDYLEIDEYCRRNGIMWFASCWDEASVDFIDKFNPPCYKIASASLTDDNLLRHTRSKGKPIILSTGMSTPMQIDHAISVIGRGNLVLMHTCSTYPSRPEELNLRTIPVMSEEYRVPIGYSGHEIGIFPSVCSIALGACIVERHITLDRGLWGSDQAASIEGSELRTMIQEIRSIEVALGDGVKRLLPSEIPILEKLRRVGAAVLMDTTARQAA